MPRDADEVLFNSMNDPSIRGGLAEPLDNIMRLSNGTFFNVLSKPLTTTPVVFYLQKNSYLTQLFSDKVSEMLSAGLIEYWIDQEKKMEIAPSTVDGDPKVLTLIKLSAPFMITAMGLFLSSIIFVVEVIFYRYKSRERMRQTAIPRRFSGLVVPFMK